jgi:hypothetical protein
MVPSGGKVTGNCKVPPDMRWSWCMGSVRSGGASGSEKMADVVRTLLLDASGLYKL